MRRKLGLTSVESGDHELIQALFDAMQRGAADFTLTFRQMCAAADDPSAEDEMRRLFSNPRVFDDWFPRWRERLARDPQTPRERARRMRAINPAFIPRNHQVEHALNAAVEQGDYQPFETLRQVLEQPYADSPALVAYAAPPAPSERVSQTFCGT